VTRRAHGVRAWLVQRVSAVYLALFTLYAALHLIAGTAASYAEWSAWLARPAVSLGWAVFFVALLAHSWVGIRDVIMDYVKPVGARLALLSLLGVALLGFGFWALQTLLQVRLAWV
jgi:succinate dehydrogenase / fumarate reductase, membrane anchor subunit